jgi:hypothetical protein
MDQVVNENRRDCEDNHDNCQENQETILRCNETCRNNMEYYNKIANNVKDNGQTIFVGLYFHLVGPRFNVKDIQTNIDYAVNTLNNDFNGTSFNKNYASVIVENYPNTEPFIHVKNMYQYAISKSRSANIRFVCMGYKTYIMNDQQFFGSYGIDSENGMRRFALTRAPPIFNGRYINIYVLPMRSLLGLGTFPWVNTLVYGIYLNRITFERNNNLPQAYNLCKTLTHEMGHTLCGLLHTFTNPYTTPKSIDQYAIGTAVINYDTTTNQDTVGDCVEDTLPQRMPTFGNPINFPSLYNQLITIYENDKYMSNFTNYMDYSNDMNMFSFTEDQVMKMRLFIFGYRSRIVTNPVNPRYNYKAKQPQNKPTQIKQPKRNNVPKIIYYKPTTNKVTQRINEITKVNQINRTNNISIINRVKITNNDQNQIIELNKRIGNTQVKTNIRINNNANIISQRKQRKIVEVKIVSKKELKKLEKIQI